ncbi:MAG: SCO family protein [Gemmataceae bacterium]
MRSRFALLLLAGITGVAGCGLFARPHSTPQTTPTDPDLDWKLEPFSLTERSGRTVTDKDLRGSVWVASFIFTRCNGPCPAVSSTVGKLQADFKDEPGVKFVTFTVDPKRDDLAALKDYANARGADPERWLFLTGDEATIHELIAKQFKQGVGRNDLPNAKPGEEFIHSSKLMVVDRNGVIRGMYEGLPNDRSLDPKGDFDANLDRLKARVKELLK